MCVAAGRKNLEDAFAQFQDRDIESPAAEIVNGYNALLTFIQAVGKGCGRRLIHDAEDVQAGDSACILCCLSLCVIEVSGNRNNSVLDVFAQSRLRISPQFTKD